MLWCMHVVLDSLQFVFGIPVQVTTVDLPRPAAPAAPDQQALLNETMMKARKVAEMQASVQSRFTNMGLQVPQVNPSAPWVWVITLDGFSSKFNQFSDFN